MDASMYREQIIDLYKNPLNHGHLEDATFSYEEDNPLCGDVIKVDVKVDDNDIITNIKWSGEGCAVSQASASLLTDELMGKSLDEVKAFDKDELLELLGIPLSMARIKCALLSLKVVKAGAYGIPEKGHMRKAHGLDIE